MSEENPIVSYVHFARTKSQALCYTMIGPQQRWRYLVRDMKHVTCPECVRLHPLPAHRGVGGVHGGMVAACGATNLESDYKGRKHQLRGKWTGVDCDACIEIFEQERLERARIKFTLTVVVKCAPNKDKSLVEILKAEGPRLGKLISKDSDGHDVFIKLNGANL